MATRNRASRKGKNDLSRFEHSGVNFRAKIIGIEDVAESRGDKMCQEALLRLKEAAKSTGLHKQKILINVTLDGLKLKDAVTQQDVHVHPVNRIAFISRDATDARAFGYIFDDENGKHTFFAIRTANSAEHAVLMLRDLFQTVYEKKCKDVEEVKQQQEDMTMPPQSIVSHQSDDTTLELALQTEESPTQSNQTEKHTENIYQVPGSNAPVKDEVIDSSNHPEATSSVQIASDETVATKPTPGPPTENLLNLEIELQTLQEGLEHMNILEDFFATTPAPPMPHAPSSSTSDGSEQNLLLGDTFATFGRSTTNDLYAMNAARLSHGGVPLSGVQYSPGTRTTDLNSYQASFQPPGFLSNPGMMQPAYHVLPAQMLAFPPSAVFSGHMSPGMYAPLQAPYNDPFNTNMYPGVGHSSPVNVPRSQASHSATIRNCSPDMVARSFPVLEDERMTRSSSSPSFTGGVVPLEPTKSSVLLEPEGSSIFDKPLSEAVPADVFKPTRNMLFGDLVDITADDKGDRTPKEMFSDLNIVPKKTLNELSVNAISFDDNHANTSHSQASIKSYPAIVYIQIVTQP